MKSPTEIKLPELIRRKTNEIQHVSKNKRQFMITIGVCILVNRQQQQQQNQKKKKREEKKDALTKYSDLNILLRLANQITCPNKSTRV